MVLVEWFTFTMFAVVAMVLTYSLKNPEQQLLTCLFSIIFFLLSGAEWWMGQTTNNLLGLWVVAPIVMLSWKFFDIAWQYYDNPQVKVRRF
jgi:hypothetical protein